MPMVRGSTQPRVHSWTIQTLGQDLKQRLSTSLYLLPILCQSCRTVTHHGWPPEHQSQSHSLLCLCPGLLVLVMSCCSVQSCISSWSSPRAQSRRETNQVTHKGTMGRSYAAGMWHVGDEKDLQPSS